MLETAIRGTDPVTLLHRFRHDGTPSDIRRALRSALHTRKWCRTLWTDLNVEMRSTEAIGILTKQLRGALSLSEKET